MKHTYEIIGSGIDFDGWFKYRLKRDDGRETKATRSRVAQLRREGKLIE